MTIACAAPDETLGVVIRLSGYLDCQARALGENGFEALTGGPIVSGVLLGAVTIFVALIGYRLVLGPSPALRDGIGWSVRVGLVLTLATSWPAFQTVVYHVATNTPEEIAAVLLPATGLPTADVEARMQVAYDAIRRGIYRGVTSPSDAAVNPSAAGQAAAASTQAIGIGLPPSPMAASMLALSSVGIGAALRLTAGLLVAIGPLAVIGALFDSTIGLVGSWIRALAGATLGMLATTLASALEIVAIESEIAHAGTVQSGLLTSESADPQAFVTIACVFCLISLIMVYAAFRATGGLRLRFTAAAVVRIVERTQGEARRAGGADVSAAAPRRIPADPAPRTRASAVSDALTLAAQRDIRMIATGSSGDMRRQPVVVGDRTGGSPQTLSLGQIGRRTTARISRSASRRDRSA